MVTNDSKFQLFLSQAPVTELFDDGQVLYDCKDEDVCIWKFHLILHSINNTQEL